MANMKPTKMQFEFEYENSKLSPEELAAMIKQKRIALNITQRQLAADLGVDYRKLSAWELGTIKSIPEDVKEKLFEKLGIENMKPVSIVLPLPENAGVMEARIAIQFLTYVMTKGINQNSGIVLTEGDKYNVNVKHNMREMLERFLLELDNLQN